MNNKKGLFNKIEFYDIIIGDFGRDATIEFLRLLSEYEMMILKTILKRNELVFFDEYRRIMYTVLGDINFYKKNVLLFYSKNEKPLDENVLVGVGRCIDLDDIRDRISLSVIQEIFVANQRGYKSFRLMIPCNTLSDLAKQIGEIVTSQYQINRILEKFGINNLKTEDFSGIKLKVHTVVDSVLKQISAKILPDELIRVLIIGTLETNLLYQYASKQYPVEIIPVTNQHIKIFEEAILASINKDDSAILSIKEEINKFVIKPILDRFNEVIVIEACTDIDLGLGINSLKLFAEAVVAECYKDRHLTID